ncbi:MAG: chemotaxis protein CheW [Deltaproteobacteria bacterium]|nr:chemotaxis protein CheW [Deltaproteobacteria bacterium]
MSDESKLMLFSVKGFVFAIGVADLLEVAEISAERISVSEEGPFSYKFDFRGIDTPVVDMARRISGMPTPVTGLLQLLVVETGSRPFALMIDKVLEVVKRAGIVYRFPEMLRTEENRYIKAIYRLNNTMCMEIGAASVLNDTELAELRAS